MFSLRASGIKLPAVTSRRSQSKALHWQRFRVRRTLRRGLFFLQASSPESTECCRRHDGMLMGGD